MSNICRLCLDTTSNLKNYYDSDSNFSYKTQIKLVMPEIDLSIASSCSLCCRCSELLNNAYTFKLECIRIQDLIKQYFEEHNDKFIADLRYVKNEILFAREKCNENVKNEIKDVALTNISFNSEDEENEICIISNERDVGLEEVSNAKIDVIYTCDKCNCTFWDRTLFLEHEQQCIIYKCKECNKLMLTQEQLDEHLQSHSFKEFLCEICSKTFKSKYYFKQHTLAHTEQNVNECNICNKNFFTKKLLHIHSAIHLDREKRYACNICNNSFHTAFALRRHKSTHVEDRKYNCNTCKKTFKMQSYLQRHIVVCHIGVMKKHVCHVCNIKCISKANLAEHLRIHTGERPFKCEICGKGFAQKGTLMVHVRSIHETQKPFTCEICGKTFTLKGNLKVHKFVHAENVEKAFSCTHCNKSFRINKELQNHIRRHLGIKTHSCPICNKGFIGSTALKIHMRSHTGERPYECDICKKTFSQKYNLQLHFKCHKLKD